MGFNFHWWCFLLQKSLNAFLWFWCGLNHHTLKLFQITSKSNHSALLLTLIWTYLLSRDPCWSQHFPTLFLHRVCLSIFMNRRLALAFNLSPAVAATGCSTQLLDESQTLLPSAQNFLPKNRMLVKKEDIRSKKMQNKTEAGGHMRVDAVAYISHNLLHAVRCREQRIEGR